MKTRPSGALSWTFGLSVIGYPVAGLLAVFLGLPSTSTSFPFRALVVVMATLTLAGNVNRAGKPGVPLPLTLFWFAYTARLALDAALGVVGAADAMFFFVITVLIPAAALARAARGWDEMAAARIVFGFGVFICISAIVVEWNGFAGDRSLTEATGRLFLETVNPITFGHAGVSTLIAGLALYHDRRARFGVPVLVAGCALAVACTLMAASRGPVLALAICAIVFSIARRRWAVVLGLAAIATTVVVGSDLGDAFRFGKLEEDESALERLLLQANALQMFFDHPVFGAAYAESTLNTYPHNMFVETAMALGIVGLSIFIYLNMGCLRRCWTQLRGGRLLLPLLFIQYFVGFQTSGSLWGSYGYWACAAVLLGLPGAARSLRPQAAEPQRRRRAASAAPWTTGQETP